MKLSKRFIALLTSLMISEVSQADTVATISVLRDGDVVEQGVGALVAEGYLLVNERLVSLGDQYQVEDSATEAVMIGFLEASSQTDDLALLRVRGLSGTPFILSKEPAIQGRKVYLQLQDDVTREGIVQSILPSDNQVDFIQVQHTISVLESEYGAPLLNNCRELVGVSHNKKQGVFNPRLMPSEPFGLAVPQEVIIQFLDDNAVAYSGAEEVCLSEDEIIARLEEERQRQQEAREEAESQRQAQEEELDRLRRESEETSEALAEAEQDRLAKEEALREAEEARQQQEEEARLADEARQQREEELRIAEQERQNQADQIAEIEADNEEEKKRNLYILVGGGAAFGLVVLTLLLLGFRRRRQLTNIRLQKESKEHELSVEKARSESMEQELVQASATFSDILFIGEDNKGDEYRVKIVGNVLARSPGGVMLGRSAKDAAFVLNAPGVSRNHLKVFLVDNAVLIMDLGSANGTAINEIKLEKDKQVVLQDGDDMRIGTVSGKVHFLK